LLRLRYGIGQNKGMVIPNTKFLIWKEKLKKFTRRKNIKICKKYKKKLESQVIGKGDMVFVTSLRNRTEK
jgi:hypothetical protein